MLKSNLKQFCPQTPHNIILFELDFNVKFPVLRLLQFLSDSKSIILRKTNILFLYCKLLKSEYQNWSKNSLSNIIVIKYPYMYNVHS